MIWSDIKWISVALVSLVVTSTVYSDVPQESESVQTSTKVQEQESQKKPRSFLTDYVIKNQEMDVGGNVGIVDSILIQRITEGTKAVNEGKCRKDLNETLDALNRGDKWALKMLDASVKVPVGIYFGDVYQFGDFDECVTIESPADSDHRHIQAQYCLADVSIEGYRVPATSARNRSRVGVGAQVHWGICLPASCTVKDVEGFLATAVGHRVQVNEKFCHIERPLEFSNSEVLFICVLTMFVMIVIASTAHSIYQYCHNDINKPRLPPLFSAILKSFSITENLIKLVKRGSDDLGLGCVNGIKTLAMTFIIAGHALAFIVGGPVQNPDFFLKQSQYMQNAFLLNSPLLVDTFLLLSGFLFARLLLVELEKRKGKVNFGFLYIFRYIRLTPAYMAVLFLYMVMLHKLGSGPLWDARIGLEQERCSSSWWINLLYLNNYLGNDKLCMFQSWYLAADTQLFILAPLLLYPLWRWRKVGIYLFAVSATVSVLIPFVVTYVNNLDPTFLAFADEIADLSENFYFINYYIKTHMRATAYIFGLLTGFIVHYMQEKNLRISTKCHYFCWSIAVFFGAASMFSIVIFYNPNYEFTRIGNALYAGLHRMGWSFFTSWIVFVCVTGRAKPLHRFLASRIMAPFSRLTYCAYLTNGLVELYMATTIRTPKYLTVLNLLGDAFSHTILTFLAALILCLVFESPIHGIEKILLQRDQQKRKRTNNSPSTSEESA
ncbi:nose resistant to fluoxetine protein 6-like isoform X1 [Lutzomyia longipalpis]|uniref:nose resistant to fluoxetine protein 6-like isoform X1 n=1 Tax=Lutzomyia longipalpis TaxID=7200 RepID=UPI0024835C29|nr:nose resistant to fluoxetine protein 6-like isoform X1 [Lutzomyia longipalpis]